MVKVRLHNGDLPQRATGSILTAPSLFSGPIPSDFEIPL